MLYKIEEEECERRPVLGFLKSILYINYIYILIININLFFIVKNDVSSDGDRI